MKKLHKTNNVLFISELKIPANTVPAKTNLPKSNNILPTTSSLEIFVCCTKTLPATATFCGEAMVVDAVRLARLVFFGFFCFKIYPAKIQRFIKLHKTKKRVRYRNLTRFLLTTLTEFKTLLE